MLKEYSPKFLKRIKLFFLNLYKKSKDIFLFLQNIYYKYNNLVSLSGILLFRLVFDLVYIFGIHKFFLYSGFILSYSVVRIILSWLSTFILALFTTALYKRTQPSAIFVILLNIFYFIPINSMYALAKLDALFYYCSTIFFLILNILQLILPSIVLSPTRKKNSHFFTVSAIVALLVTFYITVKYSKFRIILNLNNVYTWRSEAAGYNIGTLLSYLISFLPIVLSITALYFMYNKKYFFSFILLIGAFFRFSFDGSKSALFLIFLCLASYFIYNKNRLPLIPIVLGFLGIAGVLEILTLNSVYIISYFFRRNMAVPVFLSSHYFDFFTNNPIDLFRSSFLRHLNITSPYLENIPKLLGWFITATDINSNNGLIGDAFANFGYAGILISPLILVLCFRLFDACSNNVPENILFGIIVFYSISIINSPIGSVLLSHGYLLSCILLYNWTYVKSTSGGKIDAKKNGYIIKT